jgi:serine protease Do
MKNSIHCLAVICTLTLATGAHAAAEKSTQKVKEEKKELRVLASPGSERRTVIGRTMEKEKVTFLGVETSPVSNTVAAQLGLAKGSGLVVNHIVPDSAAAGALQENDILLRLDDQILIETRQLAVLIRNHKEGDEVTLTFLRAAKQTTAKVKLGQKEVPKGTSLFEQKIPLGGGATGYVFGPGGMSGRFEVPAGERREEVDRVLSMIEPGAGHEPLRFRIEGKGTPGYRATRVDRANSKLSYSDDDGSLELSVKDGEKTLVAKDSKGAQLFSGPVTTPEDRKALPDAVRGRLEKLEGMHNIQFRTDNDFLGSESRILQPAPRGIRLPMQVQPRNPALFF